MTQDIEKLKDLVNKFIKWFKENELSNNEDYYLEKLTYNKLTSLTDEEFKIFFLDFARNGGKLQSNGHRTANQFIDNVNNNFPSFKEKILEPFKDNFNLIEWLLWAESFKYFGKGLATIYLNRIDKNKFIVVNNKSIEAYEKLEYEINKTKLIDSYNDLYNAEFDFITKFPEIKNFYQSDSLSQFIIGDEKGKEIFKSLFPNNEDSIQVKLEDIRKELISIIKETDYKFGDVRSNDKHHFFQYNLKAWQKDLKNISYNIFFKNDTNDHTIVNNPTLEFHVEKEDLKPRFESRMEQIKEILEKNDNFRDCTKELYLKRNNKILIIKPPSSLNNKEIAELMKKFILCTRDKVGEILSNSENNSNSIINNNPKIEHALNQILYGPPGTGKTYNTINYALSIITGESVDSLNDKCKTKEGREKIIEEYNKYLEANQIKFITFHQSFSYEDFIEGIKPVIDKENNEELENNPEIYKTNIAYELKDGIFKSIAESALKYKEFLKNNNKKLSIDINDKTEFYKVSLGDSQVEEEINTYEHCRDNGVISIGWGNNVNFTGVKNTEDIKERFDNIIDDEKLKNQYAVSAVKNFVINMKKGDIIFVSKGNSLLRAVGIVDGNYEFKENSPIDYHQFRKVKWVLQDIELPVNKIYGKKFSQQTIYKLDKKLILHDIFQEQNENSTLSDKYVLIIDEINRGNVSNIFGELITLIETDKRHGKTESLTVELPYSNNKFSVPDNLYIIGTMNTADRSVEALDTALRRRFSFIEMHPKPELLKNIGGEINLEKLLQTINDRLEILLDKDHTIGHSYFFNVDKNNPEKSLREIFQNSIIPLLQEYFYGDWGKIGLVLGESFIKKKDVKTGFAKNFKYEDSDELIKDIFEFKPSNEWNFKSIYE